MSYDCYNDNKFFCQDVSYLTVNATDSSNANTNIDQLNGVESDGGMQNTGLMHANRISPATVSSCDRFYFS